MPRIQNSHSSCTNMLKIKSLTLCKCFPRWPRMLFHSFSCWPTGLGILYVLSRHIRSLCNDKLVQILSNTIMIKLYVSKDLHIHLIIYSDQSVKRWCNWRFLSSSPDETCIGSTVTKCETIARVTVVSFSYAWMSFIAWNIQTKLCSAVWFSYNGGKVVEIEAEQKVLLIGSDHHFCHKERRLLIPD